MPGTDEEAFLALNAEAFAGHPEQGRMTRADLDQRMAEPWFDPEGFFVAEARADGAAAAAGDLLGFHWTKVHPGEPPHGEVYVVGVSPRAQGLGLGRLLTLTGLHHLAARGLREVVLYVESDNAPAIAVYSRLGFTHADADTHVMYRRPSPPLSAGLFRGRMTSRGCSRSGRAVQGRLQLGGDLGDGRPVAAAHPHDVEEPVDQPREALERDVDAAVGQPARPRLTLVAERVEAGGGDVRRGEVLGDLLGERHRHQRVAHLPRTSAR